MISVKCTTVGKCETIIGASIICNHMNKAYIDFYESYIMYCNVIDLSYVSNSKHFLEILSENALELQTLLYLLSESTLEGSLQQYIYLLYILNKYYNNYHANYPAAQVQFLQDGSFSNLMVYN